MLTIAPIVESTKQSSSNDKKTELAPRIYFMMIKIEDRNDVFREEDLPKNFQRISEKLSAIFSTFCTTTFHLDVLTRDCGYSVQQPWVE